MLGAAWSTSTATLATPLLYCKTPESSSFLTFDARASTVYVVLSVRPPTLMFCEYDVTFTAPGAADHDPLLTLYSTVAGAPL